MAGGGVLGVIAGPVAPLGGVGDGLGAGGEETAPEEGVGLGDIMEQFVCGEGSGADGLTLLGLGEEGGDGRGPLTGVAMASPAAGSAVLTAAWSGHSLADIFGPQILKVSKCLVRSNTTLALSWKFPPTNPW